MFDPSDDFARSVSAAVAALYGPPALEKVALTPVPVGDPTQQQANAQAAGQSPAPGAQPPMPGPPGQPPEGVPAGPPVGAPGGDPSQAGGTMPAGVGPDGSMQGGGGGDPAAGGSVPMNPDDIRNIIRQEMAQFAQQTGAGGKPGAGGKGSKEQEALMMRNLAVDMHHIRKLLQSLHHGLGIEQPQVTDPTRDPNTGLPMDQAQGQPGAAGQPAQAGAAPAPAAPQPQAQPQAKAAASARTPKTARDETDIGVPIPDVDGMMAHELFAGARHPDRDDLAGQLAAIFGYRS